LVSSCRLLFLFVYGLNCSILLVFCLIISSSGAMLTGCFVDLQ
jgi:hypothetical protein